MQNDKVEEHAQRAEIHTPAHVHRLVHHYHNLIYIRYFHENLGNSQPPKWLLEELRRTDKAIRSLLIQEKSEGGALFNGEANATRKSKY